MLSQPIQTLQTANLPIIREDMEEQYLFNIGQPIQTLQTARLTIIRQYIQVEQ